MQDMIRPYYIALMIVAILATFTGIGFITLLCVLVKTKTSAKASITRAPSEAAYDNPTYKVSLPVLLPYVYVYVYVCV